ncbi:PP2C family protein-serine/threonine phosphatase [Brunnivagina elsteri]|uniref:Serine/threonine protein phosphatase n=1 Tax=Brunnivagina elsteri CCALA 953 TaxID=987040 RepID=A0A2A2TMK9_9CYAN|nr:protein phosphatase 2C domain-containing protein [Calothrix elsteri]PAX58423.1 serine/threonine protein phosphatase [Calothrix elsteri CCALA 953]
MEKDAATLYCPNQACQAANSLNHHFCHQCRTPLPKRYLWAVTEGKSLGVDGDILADRYLIIRQFILLDTKPGLVPSVPEMENLHKLKAYLRLFPYRLHVPQVYGVMYLGDSESQKQVLLLEKPPLQINNELVTEAQLYNSIDSAWGEATSMRQLNWLWQIANLWQPLASEGVASSLLDPLLMRPEGSIIKLLELHADTEKTSTLGDLGEFWRANLLHKTKTAIAEFLTQVCDSLISREIHSGEQLVAVLDQGLIELGRAENSSGGIFNSSVKIVTKTDTGPSRQRNEDSCYPPSGSKVSKPPQPTALAIVCDGIGGHEGGNVASNTAIEVIQQKVNSLTREPRDRIDPASLIADLEQAAAAANDKISQRNDIEGRQGRQRMGTTLVMALPIAHEMYVTHVGDSRAYLITRQGCYQVTLDDDVASREVRLGYAVYRDAINQGASGSLVQALGMGNSNSLHPTAQRFVLDEDCVFLLCSDGLSDFDRVEQYWESEILPILNTDSSEDVDISGVVDRLTDIANTQNGHDNVTIALVYYQIKYTEPESILIPNISDFYGSNIHDLPTNETPSRQFTSPNQRTQVIPDTAPATSKKIPLQLVILPILLAATGFIAYLFSSQRQFPFTTVPIVSPTKIVNSTASPTVVNDTKQANFPAGSLIQIKEKDAIAFSKTSKPFNNNGGFIPSGTILKVLETSPETSAPENQSNVLQVLVCQAVPIPAGPPAVDQASFVLKPNDKIWIQASQLKGSGFSKTQPASGTKNPCLQNKVDGTAPVDKSPNTSTPTANPSIIDTPKIDTNRPGNN